MIKEIISNESWIIRKHYTTHTYIYNVSNLAQVSLKVDTTSSSSMYTLVQNTESLLLISSYSKSCALRLALSVISCSRPNICSTISMSG